MPRTKSNTKDSKPRLPLSEEARERMKAGRDRGRATQAENRKAAKAAAALDTPLPANPTRASADDRFFVSLAETCNVAKSALAAGFSSAAVYKRRQRCAAFRARWQAALGEGYVRLETDLLAELLKVANGTLKSETIAWRTQKHRLALALLTHHRASVKGDTPAPAAKPQPKFSATQRKATIARLETRFAVIRQRLGMEDGDAKPAERA